MRHPRKHTGHLQLEAVSRRPKELYRAARDAKWGYSWAARLAHHATVRRIWYN